MALAGAALAAHEIWQDVIKAHNVDKIFKCCLGMEVRFINESKYVLGLMHAAYNNSSVLKKLPLDDDLLGPGMSTRVRVTKPGDPLFHSGAYGLELIHVWKGGPAWISYAVQNPINGSPEGTFDLFGPIYSRDHAMRILSTSQRNTNWFYS